MVNPYASPSDLNQITEPIRYGFGQTLTPDDLKVALWDSVPEKGLKRLQLPLIGLFIIACTVLLAMELSREGEPIPAFAWMLIGITLCPIWIWLCGRLSPQRRTRVKRIQALAQNSQPTFGVIGEDFLLDHDCNSTVRAQWSHFSRAYLFPDHLVLPVALDPSRRVVIPWRFFDSPADVRQVCQWVADRLGTLVNQPPNDEQLAAIFTPQDESTAETRADWPIDDPLRFDKDTWPHPSHDVDSEINEPFDFPIDLSRLRSVWTFTGVSAVVVCAYMLWLFLPIWIAASLWLFVNYQFWGGWDFLAQRPWSTIIVLLPIAGLLWLFLQGAITSLIKHRKQNATPLLIRLRRDGMHFAGQSFESWFTREAISQWIIQRKVVGWRLKETDEEILISAACFADEASMQQMKQRMQQLFPDEKLVVDPN